VKQALVIALGLLPLCVRLQQRYGSKVYAE
jgi:hypothetical protein